MVSLTHQQAARLSETPVGHLATADANGRPHVIPVCFAYDGQHIYSVLDAKPKRGSLTGLRRVRNILANPQVSLVIDHYDEDWTRLWYLLGAGPGRAGGRRTRATGSDCAAARQVSPVSRDAPGREPGYPHHAGTGHGLVRQLNRRGLP